MVPVVFHGTAFSVDLVQPRFKVRPIKARSRRAPAGANIRHRPIWELPRSQGFTQQKEQILVARTVVKSLVEALDLGAWAFEEK
jgi:hypothetical protein